MKRNVLRKVAVVLVLCALFTSVVGCSPKKEDEAELSRSAAKKVEEIEQKINVNNSLKTYKNNVALYEKLIDIDSNNIKWYEGLAQTYSAIGKTSRYVSACRQLVRVFPEAKSGHLMLLNYYDYKGRETSILRTYKKAPGIVQSDPDAQRIYEKVEWIYRSISVRCDALSTFSGNKYVYLSDGLYGYKNPNGYGGISARFTVARPFIEKYAAVHSDGEWYFIDSGGYRVLATKKKLEDLYSISDGFAVAKINGKYGYVDTAFNEHSFKYEDATSFYNGVAAVKKNGKWGLINKSFTPITEFIYDDVVRDDANVCSRQGSVFMRYGNTYHLLSKSGNVLSKNEFSDVRPFYGEYAAVKKNNQWGFINANGVKVIDFVYDDASSFASGVAAVAKGDAWGCVDPDGKTVLPFEYEYTSVSSDTGVVIGVKNELFKFIQFKKFLY